MGGIALCQVALTFATSRGHALIGRALYLPESCAADEEHRELAGVPEEVMFATKPELAGELLARAHERGIRAVFVAGDETSDAVKLSSSEWIFPCQAAVFAVAWFGNAVVSS